MSKIMYGMERRRVRLPKDYVERIESLPGEDFSEKITSLCTQYFSLVVGGSEVIADTLTSSDIEEP